MNNPINYSPDQPDETMLKARNAFRAAWILVAAAALTVLFYLYLAYLTSAWQLLGAAGAATITLVSGILGVILNRQGRFVLSAQVVIFGIGLAFLAFSIFIAGLGLILGIMTILLAITIAVQTLPPQLSSRAIIISSVLAIAMLLMDMFLPAYRLTVPALQIYVPLLLGIMLVVYAFFAIRQFSNYSLRTKFILVFLVFTLSILAAMAFFNNYLTRSSLTDAANQNLLAVASQTANNLDTLIDSRLDAINIEAQIPIFSDFWVVDPEDRNDVQLGITLTNLTRKDAPFILSYGLLNTDGENVADSRNLNVGKNEGDNDYFREPMDTARAYVSPVLFDPESGLPVIYFSAPVRNTLSGRLGVLRAKYRAQFLQEFMQTATEDAAEGSFAVLFDENQLHLAHSDQEIALETNYKLIDLPNDPAQITALQTMGRLPSLPVEQLSTNLPELSQNLSNLNPNTPFFEAVDTAPGGEEVLNQVAVHPLSTQPWQLAFFQPQEVLFEPITTQTQTTILLSIAISIVAGIVAVVVSQQLARPIVRLTDVAQQVTQGNLNVQASVESNDETGQLAEAFNSMTAQLRGVVGSLEEQVRERTSELALSIEVGQRAVAIRDLDTLLPTITAYIKERFNLYYVHVYFVDDLGRNLIIKYGTGTVGQTLMERQHSLPIGPGSIVGRVASSRQAIVVSNTETSDIHKPNPLLPDTRSEMAVPLIVEEKVIGVLDMQSDQVDTFRQDNATVFEALATQLAISIDSAQQWKLSQEAQRKSEETLKQVTREQWAERLSARREALGFAYNLSTISRLQPTDFDDGVSTPVVVQNQNIGQLAVSLPENRKLTEDENALLNAVAQQLGQKAENLRLFEETQQQATREQLARQIADKIRASRDIETALNTAARELSGALGVSKTAIDLNIADEDDLAQVQDSSKTTAEE